MRHLVAIIASCIALVGLLGCNEDSKGTTPTVPPPATTPAPEGSRSGLLWCYYGTIEDQVAETADHANCQWAGPWSRVEGGVEAVKDRLLEARAVKAQCVILEVQDAYAGQGAIRAYFKSLADEGLIDSRICALYPLDEPDLNGYGTAQVCAANADIRKVAAEFPFIAGVPLAVIYTAGGGWPGIGCYDWIGFDDYGKHADVLSNGTWQSMKSRMRADQRIVLVPGAAWCEDPQPFYEKAQQDQQVVAVIAFLWFDSWGGTSAPGLRSQPCRPAYEALGRLISKPTR